MRKPLLMCLVLCGCGHSSSAPPAPGPFADIAGTYMATVTGSGGWYAADAPGSTVTATVSDTGVMQTSTGATYQLTRNGDGSFLTNARRLTSGTGGTQVWETGAAPSSLSTFQLDATGYWNDGFPHSGPEGSETFAVVKTGSG